MAEEPEEPGKVGIT